MLPALAALLLAGLARADDASLTLYVFKQGVPQPDIEVLVDERVAAVTNAQGAARVSIPPGIRRLELRDQDRFVLDQTILATDGEISQWIINISRGEPALLDIESSSADGPALAEDDPEPEAEGPPGTLRGRLTSADDGAPISGARVFISGLSRDVRSGEDGVFEVEIPAGEYSVSVLHAGHNTLTRDGVAVSADEATELSLDLTPAGSELPEFVVIEPYIAGSLASVLEERRSEVAVANILGSEQISKAGDSDAASALKRVTGLTLVGGKFIYVRGLGERYSSTLLNGANVPSPDATRRVVPLDLFPAGIIDSIAVQKGYTPDMPGEFGGGTVQLRTKAVPESAFFNVELSTEYNTQTTFEDGLSYDGGGRDWTGYDDGTRDQPDPLADAIADGTQLREFNRFTGEGFTEEELEVIGESLTPNYDVTPEAMPPNFGLSLAGGNAWDFDNGMRFGFLAAMEYDNKWLTVQQQRTDYINAGGGVLEARNDFTYDITVNEISLSGFLAMGLEFGEHHALNYNWMLLRQTDDSAQAEQGINVDAEGGDVLFRELEWIERQMLANQLIGTHTLPALGGLKLDWQYTVATAETDEPDFRRYRYDPDTLTPEQDDLIFSLRNDSNQRRWSALEDNADSWNLDLVQPITFGFLKNSDFAVRAGLSNVEKDRDSQIRRFTFVSKGSISGNVDLRRNLSLDDVIFDETIAPNGWQLEESTLATDAYTAEQQIDAWYLGLDVNLGEWMRFSAGARDETSDQSVTTFDIFDPDRNPVVSTLSTDDVLPSATLTLLFGDHQVRAGYGETVNRPDFKELSPSLFKDPILDRLVIGNPDLEAAFITHYDLRWDYYFNPGEFVSLGAFYKEFETPIESVILAGAANITSYDNAEAAENVGAEFELYKTLQFLDDWWGWGGWLERVYVNTNYAWIDSEITLSPENAAVQTSNQRPLQGQSPYVWNFQLGYDDEQRGINAALLYNIFGERIVDVGTNGAPDIFEEPRPQLDFVYSQQFGEFKLKFKARNLLDPDIELT
ncbi:MAG: outer membrane beta-barrel protein, partial [Xanthomonadales bacterium]|nr:outer membrane beta-barrel protein [Xanthomonadales bacterium]